MPLREASPLLTSIQAARGTAALAAVLCHAGTILGSRLPHDPFGGVLRAGHAGVDFFFVLSGFIIATAHRSDISRPAAFGAYAWKRLTRVYPMYWIATCVALVLAAKGETADRLLTSLLLMPRHTEPILGVAWTLEHEMLFYLAFGVLILSRTAGTILVTGWLVFAATMLQGRQSVTPWNHPDPLRDFIGASYNLEFSLGLAVAILLAHGRVPRPRLLATLGMLGFLITAAAEDAGKVLYLGQVGQALFGITSAMVLAGLAAAEQSGTLRAGRLAVFLGTASYAIYLVHVPLMIGAASLVNVTRLPAAIGAAALIAVGVGGGAALHLWIERPLLRALQRSRPRASPPQPLPDPNATSRTGKATVYQAIV